MGSSEFFLPIRCFFRVRKSCFLKPQNKGPRDPYLPGDSSRDLFIPDCWRSRLQPFQRGHVNSPSQKGHQQNCQVYNYPSSKECQIDGTWGAIKQPPQGLNTTRWRVLVCIYILYTHVADWQCFKRKSTRNTMVVVPDSNEHNPRGLRVAKPLTIGVDKQQQSLIHRKNTPVHYNQPTIYGCFQK